MNYGEGLCSLAKSRMSDIGFYSSLFLLLQSAVKAVLAIASEEFGLPGRKLRIQIYHYIGNVGCAS